MSILKPTDPSSAIKTLNGDSANTNSLINHALTVASNAYEKSESLDATVNGEKLKDPSGESIYQRDDDGNIIYNNDGTPVIKRDTSGLVTIVASKVSISQLEAESARIDTLEANSVTTETLNAEKARIDALETSKANIDDLNAEKARIDNLETNKADISTLNAEKARIDALEAGKADISSLTAESARIDNLEANKADITSLNAEIARIDTLEAGKADIDLANVNNAWITNGVIKDASIANEKVISVSANKLTAGTIDASKITVTNLNADNITVGTINGARIGDSSIDLGKLSQEVPTKEYLDSVEKKLQEEIDGAIETFTVSEIPTLNNEPAVNWTTNDIKSTHIGDLCYVVNNASDKDGFCYRFQYNGTVYSWALIKDNDVTKAIQDIAELGGEVNQFKTDYTSKVSQIDGGIESLKSRTTTIETTYSTKTYAENKANEALTSANSYSDGKASSTLSSAKTYTDNTASSTLTSANKYSDNKASDALTSANSYADNKASSTLTNAKSYTDSTASSTLGQAKNYTDTATADMATTGDIPTKVSELTNDSNFATTTQVSTAKSEAISTASADATSKANSALDSAKSYTDAIEIGGRNLIKNSNFTNGFAYWIKYGESNIVDDWCEVTIDSTWGGIAQHFTPIQGVKYILSYEAYLVDTSVDTARLESDFGSPDQNIVIDKTPRKYSNVIKYPSNLSRIINFQIGLGRSEAGKKWRIRKIKLEIGDKATDWTPAPEDVDAGIASAQTSADSAASAAANAQTTADTAKANAATAQSTADTAKSNAAAAQTAASNAQTTANDAKAKAEAAQTAVSTKVETSVFNTLKNTVDENSANITSLTETITTKADSSTVTTLSNTVNEVKQTADANSSSISSLTTTVNTKADGSKVTALETKTSTIEQNLNGVTTKVTNLESTSEGLDTRLTAAEANITVTSDAITSKVSKNEVISAINQTAESISIDASKINLNGAVTFTSFDSSLQTTINNKAETSDLEAVRTTADAAQDNALSAQEAADALDTDLNDFKSNEYSQINDKVGELVEYKGENEKEIGKIREELSKELVAQKFAKIENGSLILGEIDNTTAILTNAQFGFYAPNSEIPASYFGKDGDAWAFSIERGIIKNDLRFGGFQWIARSNKNMSLKWLD